MTIKLYDSLKQTKVALPEGKITIYNCGPTVYNHIHLGNLRPVIIFDFLVRYLRAINYQVVYVHNITDIDDKIIAQSKIVGCCAKKIAATYTNEYLKIMRTMNWVVPDYLPQVSTNIPMIIAYIEKLLRLGFGYQVGGDVLFAINRVEEYGELSKQKTSRLYVNTRNTVTTNKQQVQDFFL